MKKVYTFILSMILLCGWSLAQNPVTWTDDFSDNEVDTNAWKNNPGKYEFEEANGELSITVTKGAPWDGFYLRFGDGIDLADNPYASFKIKADTALDFRIYLWDENEEDTLYNRSNADVWIVPGDTYYTYYFSWRNKFLHAETVEEVEVLYEMDSTDIEGFLINIEPGIGDPLYQGTLVFDDVKIGEAAELSFAEAELTVTALGSIGTTALSDLPEQTTVQTLLDGLNHNGDELFLFASGNPGKAGVEAEGTDILDKTMKIVVILDGSNPRKYNVLVAPPALNCYYRADFPTVDAEIDEVWNTVPAHEMGQLLNGSIDGPSDLGATFRTLWDEVSLFFLVEVDDDIEFVDDVGVSPWADDAVEIWLDLNNSKNSAYLPSETDEYQFIFSKGVTNTYMVHHHDAVEGLDWAWINTQTGYIFEIEMPWLTSFEWLDKFSANHPYIGQKLGFEIHVNDDDDGAERETNIGWWNVEDLAWTDPSSLGDLKMEDELYESVRDIKNNLKFRMYPNPASEQIQLISSNGIQEISIVNIAGQTILKTNVDNKQIVDLNISNLVNSIYMVIVRDQYGNVSSGKLIVK